MFIASINESVDFWSTSGLIFVTHFLRILSKSGIKLGSRSCLSWGPRGQLWDELWACSESSQLRLPILHQPLWSRLPRSSDTSWRKTHNYNEILDRNNESKLLEPWMPSLPVAGRGTWKSSQGVTHESLLHTDCPEDKWGGGARREQCVQKCGCIPKFPRIPNYPPIPNIISTPNIPQIPNRHSTFLTIWTLPGSIMYQMRSWPLKVNRPGARPCWDEQELEVFLLLLWLPGNWNLYLPIFGSC